MGRVSTCGNHGLKEPLRTSPKITGGMRKGCLALGDVDLNGIRQETPRLSVWGSTCPYDCMVYDLFPKRIF